VDESVEETSLRVTCVQESSVRSEGGMAVGCFGWGAGSFSKTVTL
jgi:hypothetical protein